jgi:hypothetical protein
MDKTAALRKRRQRESSKKWLALHARGKSPDALVTALQNNECKLVWLVEETKKKKGKPLSD